MHGNCWHTVGGGWEGRERCMCLYDGVAVSASSFKEVSFPQDSFIKKESSEGAREVNTMI